MRAAVIRTSAVLALVLLTFAAGATRKTPSIRDNTGALTSGAHTLTESIPSGSTWAVLAVCMFNDSGLQAPTLVSLDSQSATLRESSGTSSGVQLAMYTVTGFGTGSKTLAYTLSASGTYYSATWAIEFRDGTPTFGDHDSNFQVSPPASTRAINNTSGDEIISAYCSKDDVASPTMGVGQSKLDDTHDATPGHQYYGFTTETASGTPDVQSVGVGGAGSVSDIAGIAVTVASNASFTIAPSYSTVSNTQIKTTFTAASAGLTYYCALYAPGASAPTAAQIMAGTGAHSSVITGSTTGSSENHNMTASDSPTYPKYDPYCVLYNGGTPGTVATTSQTQTTPPSTCGAANNQACQYVTLSSVAIGGIAAVATLAYDGQTANFVTGETVTGGTSGAVAVVQSDSDSGATGTLTLWIASGTFQNNETLTGSVRGLADVNGIATYLYAVNDVLVAPTYVSPAGASYLLTIGADGNAVYDTVAYDGGAGRETATNIKVYDYSAVGYASGDIDWVNNNSAPSCPGLVVAQHLLLNQAMTSFDWDNNCTDAESDTLNSVALSSLPTGISLNGTTNVTSGTPTVANAGTTVRYVIYDTSGALAFRDVFFEVVESFPMPDCVSTRTLGSTCSVSASSNGLVIVDVTDRCDAHIPSGYVISQSPDPGTAVSPGETVSLVVSLGNCKVKVPNCLSKTASQCSALLSAGASGATFSTTCAATAKIFSQSPAANSKVANDFTLTALCH